MEGRSPGVNSSPIIKVCGLCRAEDGGQALDAGANALGFVHHPPSVRHLDLQLLAQHVQRTRERSDARTVLVLVDVAPDRALDWAVQAGVSHLQLCGREDPLDWVGLRAAPRLWRRVAVQSGASEELEAWGELCEAFVLDHPEGPGGTGIPVDTSLARDLASRAPCILAGGLDGESVGAQVAAVDPMGVDASSRLEREPGIKDSAAVSAFVQAARPALAAGGAA